MIDIYAEKLINNLKDNGWIIGKRNFTVDVVGGLRKANIIIAGSPIGYKLALSLDDIKEYLEHDKKIILPMLYKLSKTRSNIQMLMNYDILEVNDYIDLKTMLESLATKNVEIYAETDEYDVETASPLTNETF